MPRVRLDEDDGSGGSYFAQQNSSLEFIHSGCAVLDRVLGGGWPLTRFSNVVGDESTGKTLVAEEALSNFHRQFPKGKMFYREAESAFDEGYARAIGTPVDQIDFIEPEKFETISDFYDDLCKAVDICRRKDVPGFYACDSLDGLCSVEEKNAKSFDKATYGMGKAKDMHRLCRLLKSQVARARLHLMVVSQTKYKIDAIAFGEKKTRSGGKALDFFASQALWLSHSGNEVKTVNGIKRVIGIKVRARCKKNKIALPYRQCEFTIRFGHGIDSISSSLDWLQDIGRVDEVLGQTRKTYEKDLANMTDNEYWKESSKLDDLVSKIWYEVEEDMLHGVRRKYVN